MQTSTEHAKLPGSFLLEKKMLLLGPVKRFIDIHVKLGEHIDETNCYMVI